MLYLIKTETDQYFNFLIQDPVRPSIPHKQRIGINKDVFVSTGDQGEVKAITCVSYQSDIPVAEQGLFADTTEPSVAIFYTIWSYVPGAGRSLIFNAVDYIKHNKPNIRRFVTLSPSTDMAKRFHVKNGAVIHRVNPESVNYEYVIPSDA